MTAPHRVRSAPGRAHQRRPVKPELRVVPDPRAVRARRLSGLLTGLVAVAICFGLFGVIGVHVMLAQGQTEVQQLQDKVRVEQERQQKLRLEVAELEAPSHVVDAAKARGMVTPTTVIALALATLDKPPPTTIPPPTQPTTTAVTRP